MKGLKLMLPDGRWVSVGDRVNGFEVIDFKSSSVMCQNGYIEIYNIKTIQHCHEWVNVFGEKEKMWEGDVIYKVSYKGINENTLPYRIMDNVFTKKQSAQKYFDSLNCKWKVKPEDWNEIRISTFPFTEKQKKSIGAYSMLLWAMNQINECTYMKDECWSIRPVNDSFEAVKNSYSTFKFISKEKAEYFIETFNQQIKELLW